MDPAVSLIKMVFGEFCVILIANVNQQQLKQQTLLIFTIDVMRLKHFIFNYVTDS